MVTGIHQATGIVRRNALRAVLLAGVATSLPVMAGSAFAQDVTIDTDTTSEIETNTVDGGNPANIIVTEDGSITLDNGGTAITVNSDNDVEHDGEITLGHVDNAIGILIEPGFAGDITIGGDILMNRTDEQTEQNSDEMPTDYADNRFGLLLAAGGTHTGDIILQNGSVVRVFGDESAAIDLSGALDGDLSILGNVNGGGENFRGLAIRDTVTGDVTIGSAAQINVGGVGSTAVLVDGTIEGALTHNGSISATGYFDTTVDSDADPDENNDEQAALQGGPAIDIRGTIANGFLINGNLPVSEQDEDYTAISAASVSADGSAPAIWIHGGAVLGELDTSELSDAYGDWGFINRGGITARGIYSGVDSTSVLAEDATIFGGIRNDGTIRASAFNANATGLMLGDGISLGSLYTGGTIETGVAQNEEGDVASTAVHITSGATVPTINNDGVIRASVTGDYADAVGILDESGTVTEIINTGGIVTSITDFNDEEGVTPTGERIAIDVSANTTGVTVRNTVTEDFDPDTDNRQNFGAMRGDILFGSGDDQYLSDAGTTVGDISFGMGNDMAMFSDGVTMTGNIDFGMGNDTLGLDDVDMAGDLLFGDGMDVFNILNGAFYAGDVTDSDGMLDITVSGGSSFYETGADVTNISNLMIGSASTLGIGIAENGASATSFVVSDTAMLEDGATIQPIFLGGAVESVTADIILASTLNVNADQLVIGDEEGNVPYLFDISVSTATGTDGDRLILNVQRRTAEALGIPDGLAPAYVPTLNALATDDDLGPLVLNFTEAEDFDDALSQLLAGPLDAPIAYARSQNNSVTSIITQRLDLARNSGAYPRTFWIQEENYFLNRDSDEISNGFDGGGFSLAAGVDMGLDNFIDAVGISASISSAKYDEKKGGDFPFSRLTYGLGAYAAFSQGPIQLDVRGEYAITKSESERNITIGTIDRRAEGEWDGTQLAANARLKYTAEIMGLTAEPFVSADYVTIDEDAYEETGGEGINLAVADRSHDSLRGNVGLRVGKVFELQPSAYDTGIPGTLHPQFTIAWSQELIDDPLEAEYRYLSSDDSFTLYAEPEDGAAILGADIAYENEYAKVHVGVSGSLGDTTEAIILRAGVGLKW